MIKTLPAYTRFALFVFSIIAVSCTTSLMIGLGRLTLFGPQYINGIDSPQFFLRHYRQFAEGQTKKPPIIRQRNDTTTEIRAKYTLIQEIFATLGSWIALALHLWLYRTQNRRLTSAQENPV